MCKEIDCSLEKHLDEMIAKKLGQKTIAVLSRCDDTDAMLQWLFEEEGYRVLMPRTEAELQEMLKSTKIDVLMVGYYIDRTNIKEVLPRLENKPPQVLLLTGRFISNVREEVPGVTGYVMKPFEVSSLISIVKDAAA